MSSPIRPRENPPTESKRTGAPLSAKELALNQLGRRIASSTELMRYLKRKGIAENEAADVVSELIRQGWLDDRRVAESYVRAEISRGKGGRAIQAKLRLKGLKVSLEEIHSIGTDAFAPSEEERAIRWVERRYARHREDPKIAARAFRGLLRQGFSMDLAKRVLKRQEDTD